MDNRAAVEDLVLEINDNRSFDDGQPEQREHVHRVKLRRMNWHLAGDVTGTAYEHLSEAHLLACNGSLDIAAALAGEVDDDRAR